jgi:hypothetical protein
VAGTEDAAIRALLDRQVTGWAAGDPEAYATVIKGARRRNPHNVRVNTSIAVRTDDGWLLAASHNTTYRRFAEKLLGTLISRQYHRAGDRALRILRPTRRRPTRPGRLTGAPKSQSRKSPDSLDSASDSCNTHGVTTAISD